MTDKYLKISTKSHTFHPDDDNCSVKKALDIFHHKWCLHVIFELLKSEVLRFGGIKALIPAITNTMLTATLRQLESDGIVGRKQFNEIPPHVEYSLTEKGKALRPILTAITEWSIEYAQEK